MLCGQESNTKTTTLKLILKNPNKQMLLKFDFGPESEATFTESVGLSKFILHTISFQSVVYLPLFCSFRN